MPHRWCDSAELRRKQIESGTDLTFNKVFKPIFIEKVLGLNREPILEVGAGTGHLSKELAANGLRITAVEPSTGMFKVAKEVLDGSGVELINCLVDDLPEHIKYEVAISHLVAHVVNDSTRFFNSIANHLEVGGHFVFSIPHPCFFNGYKKIFGDHYCYMESAQKEISFTITKDPNNVISGVPYHHRPLTSYISSLVSAGFAIDGFEETWPSYVVQKMYGEIWENPRYCVFICKKL